MPYKDRAEQNEYIRQWKQKRRDGWLREHGPCKCGSWDDLEVDHIDPATKARDAHGRPIRSTHVIWTWSEERRAVELAKCQALCGNCHKIKTAEEHRAKMVHGSLWMYRLGCRCEACREAKSANNATRQR